MTTDSTTQQDETIAERIRRLFEHKDYGFDSVGEANSDYRSWLDNLHSDIVPNTMPVDSPRFIGHMTSAIPAFHAEIAGLVTSLNQNLVKRETSGVLTDLERNLLNSFCEFVFDQNPISPESYLISRNGGSLRSERGILTSGGTLANITALWCARNRLLEKSDADANNMVVIGSELLHYSFDKAVDLLGLGPQNLIRVPVDETHRVEIPALIDAIEDCQRTGRTILALVGIAGTTDSGATDPLFDLAEIAAEKNIYFHVDAAWGGPLLFSETHGHQLRGIERADSVTLDGHKQLYTPLGIGLLLFRDPKTTTYIEKTAPYAVRQSADDLGRRSLEGTRQAMSLYLDAALRIIGSEGYSWLIDESIGKAQILREEIEHRDEFELLVEPQSNIVLYRHLPPNFVNSGKPFTETDNAAINEWNIDLQRRQRQEGRTFVSRTTIRSTQLYHRQEVVALRAILANPLTGQADITAVLEDQFRIAKLLD